ncbi:MAG: helix-turn-helix transcriptional regulator [Coriobacteriaceae bacterium]|nr:helix-turn-helix transcriptional regulator [Coriobacteriaceae bacterium]
MLTCFFVGCQPNGVTGATGGFLNYLKHMLAQRGISISEFARTTGISQPAMNRIVNGKSRIESIRAENFLRIAWNLGISAEQLYFGEDTYDDAKRDIDRVYATTSRQGRDAMAANARGIDAAYPHHDPLFDALQSTEAVEHGQSA